MTAVVDQQLKSGFALRLIDYEILKELQHADGVRLLGEVARRLSVHATTVSIACDRLAERGLLTRQRHPTDRRATLVTITGEGRAVAEGATAALCSVGFGVTADDARTLTDALTSLYGSVTPY
ncbi:MarR family winged helix-turn-helix transcriptional regulator [Mycolicibacterium arseniciresistens]|uniref:MarR family transcriptional regulator n=1 Tax=Mycolicibacterium arseniciresistens TaxID=3062257 RepID=A0ABT8UGT5_9MYCO|nr:MarR family transcriptional regulator [Mycolicibacterium arseniciresistens]MDO3637012.1 MarR family transcriptional regulator [Mycolicibacterium arseniciresistens]